MARKLLRLLLGAGLLWGGWSFGPGLLKPLLEPLLPPPQQILVLGGDLEREEVGAQLAYRSPHPPRPARYQQRPHGKGLAGGPCCGWKPWHLPNPCAGALR